MSARFLVLDAYLAFDFGEPGIVAKIDPYQHRRSELDAFIEPGKRLGFLWARALGKPHCDLLLQRFLLQTLSFVTIYKPPVEHSHAVYLRRL